MTDVDVKDNAEEAKAEKKGASKLRKRVAAIVVAVLVVVSCFVGYNVFTGDLAPVDAAAKYDGFNYLPESEVSDYIATYREQMGLSKSSDEDWATFLAAYNLTPQRLRYSTIRQIIKDKLVEAKAKELGISASDEEIEASITTLRDTLGLGDEEILNQTLQSHGQTEEGLREVYRHAIVNRLVLSSEVPVPTPSEDEVREQIKTTCSTLASPTVRHTFCFKKTDGQDGQSDQAAVQKLRDAFADGEKTREAFTALVSEHGDDDLRDTGGANGWDIDSSEYSPTYQEELELMKLDDVSPVFRDGDALCFIWVSDEFALPAAGDEKAVEALGPDSMPSSLWSYFSDLAGYTLWKQAGSRYIENMLEAANVVYYPMPSDVPYNVDMGLADVQLEEMSVGSE